MPTTHSYYTLQKSRELPPDNVQRLPQRHKSPDGLRHHCHRWRSQQGHRPSFNATADANGKISVRFEYGNNYASINAIQLLSGSTVVQAFDCGNSPGGTFNITSNNFQNQGSLAVSKAEILNVSGLTGTGVVQAESGSTLNLRGSVTIAGVSNTFSIAPGAVFRLIGGLTVNGAGVLPLLAEGTLSITDSLLGDTQNAAKFANNQLVSFEGSGSAERPQFLEAMSLDLGAFRPASETTLPMREFQSPIRPMSNSSIDP